MLTYLKKIINLNIINFIYKDEYMAKILFNITNGTNNPTKSSLGFMLARTAVEEGHEVQVFLNADAVSLIRKPVLENLVGLGTGKLKEHFDILLEAKVPIYVSAISCEIRGVTEDDLKNANSIKVLQNTSKFISSS